jgi:hypothetical protein
MLLGCLPRWKVAAADMMDVCERISMVLGQEDLLQKKGDRYYIHGPDVSKGVADMGDSFFVTETAGYVLKQAGDHAHAIATKA